ncbi:hypothetical protein [uncultured Algibacter sp.]|uniref:hypothetical protein n=1 Tax=uncultured Algibacter sp. TaxID=298659 RepID=UPI002622F074|nr:hypothetical protein [uncultured Algibacter sp.]
MKNLLTNLTLILSLIILTSCSSDDSGNTENQTDPLIGTWEYSTQFENDTQITVNDCSPSTIEFTQAGNRTDLYYGTDNSGNCVVVDTVNMTWEKLSDGTYEFTQNGFTFSDVVTFENDKNTVTFEDSDTDGNGNVVVYRFVYTRIN